MCYFSVIVGNLLHEFQGTLELPAVELCELWVSKKLHGYSDIILNTLLILIKLSLEPKAPVSKMYKKFNYSLDFLCISILITFVLFFLSWEQKQLIKRVWDLRNGLCYLSEKTNEEKAWIIKILLKCFSCATYLNCDDGTKFLSLLIVANSQLMKSGHTAIKHQLPFASKTHCTSFAEVYFRAWKRSSSEQLRKARH